MHKALANRKFQALLSATLYFLSPARKSISHSEHYRRQPLQHWPRLRTAAHLQLGTRPIAFCLPIVPLTFCSYQTGTLLIATLQPRFTILHNLTTSRGPSPVINLSWHASSSRQKSEMLAVQKHDGDLRVWSVAKSYSMEDPAKVVRILRKTEALEKGSNWMGWSKNGRVIQFSDR